MASTTLLDMFTVREKQAISLLTKPFTKTPQIHMARDQIECMQDKEEAWTSEALSQHVSL